MRINSNLTQTKKERIFSAKEPKRRCIRVKEEKLLEDNKEEKKKKIGYKKFKNFIK